MYDCENKALVLVQLTWYFQNMKTKYVFEIEQWGTFLSKIINCFIFGDYPYPIFIFKKQIRTTNRCSQLFTCSNLNQISSNFDQILSSSIIKVTAFIKLRTLDWKKNHRVIINHNSIHQEFCKTRNDRIWVKEKQ